MSKGVTITQEAGFLMDLMKRIKSGQAAPAVFQREYVWGADDVLALWTSIIKGYPLGAFLLWKPEGNEALEYSRPMMGPIGIEPGPDSSLILDGQNRLVSLAWSMIAATDDISNDAPGYELWRDGNRLVADPATQSMIFLPMSQPLNGLQMPASSLFDNSLFNRFLRDAWDGEEYPEQIEWLDRLTSLIREARIVVATIQGGTPREAVDAFVHIARAGVPVSEQDLAAAFNLQG